MNRATSSFPALCAAFHLGIGSVLSASAPAPLTPAGELGSFQFADQNLTAELVAAEPDIVSPASITWDADGRLFVAEMRDYPDATNGGTIRVLRDRNLDGRYETASLFADHLSFPNSVLAWNDGVLVTAAPDLLFLKDADGDGRADERRVTGFGTGNQQLRANGLTWGIDGWVYGANGRSETTEFEGRNLFYRGKREDEGGSGPDTSSDSIRHLISKENRASLAECPDTQFEQTIRPALRRPETEQNGG